MEQSGFTFNFSQSIAPANKTPTGLFGTVNRSDIYNQDQMMLDESITSYNETPVTTNHDSSTTGFLPQWSNMSTTSFDQDLGDHEVQMDFEDMEMDLDDYSIKGTGDNGGFVWNRNPRRPTRRNARRAARDKDQDFFSNIFGSGSNGHGSDSESENNGPRKGKCENPECDHKPYSKRELESGAGQTQVLPISEIRNIEDLMALGRTYHCKKNAKYHELDLRILFRLIVPLGELRDMVGMEKVKRDIVNQIIFFLQGFNRQTRCNACIDCSFNRPCKQNLNSDMLHTVITGPPGVGKTELGRILGHIYRAMGILKKGHMKVVKRSDLIGKYLGHTAAKTQAVIDQARGGVLFIDEAYSLGNKEGRDSFSKECLDTLNQNLTERRDFLCIIAGYRDQLQNCFFNYNEGLNRRFSFRYDIEGYGPEELRDIFLIKVKKAGWKFESESEKEDGPEERKKKQVAFQTLTNFFVTNHQYFPHFGGDVETLFLNCKIYHGRRVLLLEQNAKKMLTVLDVERGFNNFVEDRETGHSTTARDRMMWT